MRPGQPKATALDGRQASRAGAQARGEPDPRTADGRGSEPPEAREAAGIDPGYIAQIEAGLREPSISVLCAMADALGADVSVRLFPNTGSRIRDHIQAVIGEELLRIAHPRWRRLPEVGVYRPARGRVDLVLLDPSQPLAVATEVHSQVRRLEQQVGWAQLKSESLPSADFWRFESAEPAVSRLLVLRSTRATRDAAARFEETLRAAYPAPATDVFAALKGEAPWPGAGLLWADVTGATVRILERPPRGVRIGR
jgi:transcriptional regulator with XRE-family HTH domain